MFYDLWKDIVDGRNIDFTYLTPLTPRDDLLDEVLVHDVSTGTVKKMDLSVLLAGMATDEKVGISSNDTTPDYLFEKMTTGTGVNTLLPIELQEINDGGDEDLNIQFDITKLYATLNTKYLLLDCSNDPLTNTLNGLNFNFTNEGVVGGILDVVGHSAFGGSASALNTYVMTVAETLDHLTGVRAGDRIDVVHSPSAPLTGVTNLIGDYVHSKWDSAEDGTTLAYIYGVKQEAICFGTGGVNTLTGGFGIARHQGFDTVSMAIGLQGHIINDDVTTESGHITEACSLLASGYTDRSGGIITDRYGLKIEDITGGGRLTNQVGLFIESLTAGTGNNYPIVVEDFGAGVVQTDASGVFSSDPLEAGDIPALDIYVLLLGRSGGQKIYGGTDSGDSLTFEPSTNATKGDYYFTGDRFFGNIYSGYALGIGGGDGTNIAGGGATVAVHPFFHHKAPIGVPYDIVDGTIPYRILASSAGAVDQKIAGEFILAGNFYWVILNDNLSTKHQPMYLSMDTGNVTIQKPIGIQSPLTMSDSITMVNQNPIYFDSTDTYIAANTDNPEDLIIAADQDILLEPDNQVIFNTGAAFPFVVGNGASNTVGLLYQGAGGNGAFIWISLNDYFQFNDDILMVNQEKIFFDSVDTWIGANSDDPEDLEIHADQDILLMPDRYVGIGTLTPATELQLIGIGRFGGASNYAQFAIDGELTLEGTAKVLKETSIPAESFSPGASGATRTYNGDFGGYAFTIGDDMKGSIELPFDIDPTSNLSIFIYWYIDEAYAANSGEVQWQITWGACPTNASEAVDAPTHSGTIDFGDQNIPANAKYLTKTSAGSIAAASLLAGDMIGFTISRVALDGGNNPVAEPVMIRVEFEYISNRLGEAT